MKKNRWYKVVGAAVLMSSLLTLSACGGDTSPGSNGSNGSSGSGSGNNATNSGSGNNATNTSWSVADFPIRTTNTNAAIEGGILNYAIMSSSPFAGLLHSAWGTTVMDSRVRQFFHEYLLAVDENFMYTQDGPATFEVSDDFHTFTFTIRDEVYWSDGYPVTARDWAFAFEVISHPDYTGLRFGANFLNIVGVEAFHNGEVDYISGIRILDERVLEIEFIEPSPSLLSGAIWSAALPYHIFGSIPVAEMENSAAVRQNPIGFGPFILDVIVPGESVTFVRNENHWRGRPVLDGVILRVISPEMIAQEMRSGGIDIVDVFPAGQIAESLTANWQNVEWLGITDNAYNYIAFSLGNWDEELGRAVPNPNATMADVNLRRAMWYALDHDLIAENFFQGLRWTASTVIPPTQTPFHNPNIPSPGFSPDTARQILDDAGFIDIDGDGFRETPDGEQLVINFHTATGDAISQAIDQFYVQLWSDIGLNVNWTASEFNVLVSMLNADDPSIDMFSMAWGVGWDVNPWGRYSAESAMSRSRWVSENNERLIAAGISLEAFDLDFRRAIYDEWQAYMIEQVPVIPTLFRARVVPVNNRVLNFELTNGNAIWYNVALSSPTSY